MAESLHTLILRRMAHTKNRKVAEALGCDESTVSRISSGERGIRLDEMEAFLTTLGVAWVEAGTEVQIPPAEEVRALQVFARKGLRFVGKEDKALSHVGEDD